jgi:SAM-dependent methyltransferase
MQVIKSLKRPVRTEDGEGPPHFIFKEAFAKARSVIFRGDGVECPCCARTFKLFMFSPYMATLCPNCLSIERYRLLCLFLDEETDFGSREMRVLDIAPMWSFQEFCRRHDKVEYLSIDIASPIAMRHMDIRALDLPDDQFDCIICYHVLEHIDNEAKALSELRRVLKPDGWAVIQVPIHVPRTVERSDLTEAQAGRILKFPDHRRAYGPEYSELLEAAGFEVQVVPFARSMSPEQLKRYGIDATEDIYVSRIRA